MNIVVISHKEDLDGIVSAAFIKMFYADDIKKNVEIYLCDHDDYLAVLGDLVNKKMERLYLLDLPVTAKELKVVEKLNSESQLYYIDHHQVAQSIENSLKQIAKIFCVDYGLCTAQILASIYPVQNRKYQETLVLLAETMDFGKRTSVVEICVAFSKILGVLGSKELLQLVNDFALNNVLNTDLSLKDNYIGYWKMAEDKEKQLLDKAYKTITIRDVKIVIAFFKTLSLNIKYIFLCMYKTVSSNIYMVMVEDTQNIFMARSIAIQEYYFIDQFCLRNNGGGRDDAGGFKSYIFLDKNNYVEVAEKIINDFNNYREEQM